MSPETIFRVEMFHAFGHGCMLWTRNGVCGGVNRQVFKKFKSRLERGQFAECERIASGCAQETSFHDATSIQVSFAHPNKAANTRVKETIHKTGPERKDCCHLFRAFFFGSADGLR